MGRPQKPDRGETMPRVSDVYCTLPGWRPAAERPRCYRCGEQLRIHVVNRKEPQPDWPDGSKRIEKYVPCAIRYGYQGDGRFCTMSCGYIYALSIAGGAVDHSKGRPKAKPPIAENTEQQRRLQDLCDEYGAECNPKIHGE